jgi:hypothetical protein
MVGSGFMSLSKGEKKSSASFAPKPARAIAQTTLSRRKNIAGRKRRMPPTAAVSAKNHSGEASIMPATNGLSPSAGNVAR